MIWWGVLLLVFATFILGLLGGFFLARYLIIRELRKNPPVNANMIRAMYRQVGRKPSETQINSIVAAMSRKQ